MEEKHKNCESIPKSHLRLFHCSCVDEKVDAIVNAANCYLAQGGGVCGAIFKKAGANELSAACSQIKTPLEDGQAVITPAFNITYAKAIIHAVGPNFARTPTAFNELFEAYYNSLLVLKENDLHSIAFPLISSGIYGGMLKNPVAESTEQCCRAFDKFILEFPEYQIDVRLCAFTAEETENASKALDLHSQKNAEHAKLNHKGRNIMRTNLDEFELNNKLQELLAILDADELPELHEYIAHIMDEDEGVTEEPYEIANQILNCDKQEDLPEVVRDFVIELFEDAFKDGNADAANDLGAQYYDGSRGFEQDFSKAVYYYNLAAENGSRQAQENLGYCYYYGRNMPVDYEKAFHYFALGAFDGHLISLYKIGDMYAAGYYVKKNEKEAFHIYERCIDTMTDEAAPVVAGPVFLRLGKCFLNGVGTEKDYEKALICYQKAELYLYNMVKKGDVMYKKSLQAAIDGQTMARAKRAEELPDKQWLDGIKN